MSLSVVAGRSHSGFRAAVYGIHFDPWGFDTLLYFVKMVAVFCFNGCRELAFLVYAKELPAEDCPTLTFFPLRGSILRLRRAPSLRATRFGLSHFRFHTAAGIHPPPSARPFSKGLLASDYLTFAFTPLRGFILRLRRAPSLRGYPLRDYLTFAFTPLRRIGFNQSQTFLDDVFYVLPHVFEVVLDVEV